MTDLGSLADDGRLTAARDAHYRAYPRLHKIAAAALQRLPRSGVPARPSRWHLRRHRSDPRGVTLYPATTRSNLVRDEIPHDY